MAVPPAIWPETEGSDSPAVPSVLGFCPRIHPVRQVISVSIALAASANCVAQQFVRETTTRFPTQSEYTNQLSFCDVDSDGDLDIAWANGQGYSSLGALLKPRLYLNDGTGRYSDVTDVNVAGITGCFRGVEFGDVDRDGDWDMLLAQDYARPALLLLNNGSGVFTAAPAGQIPAINLGSSRGQFGDIDNDGDLDIALCHSGTNRFGTTAKPKIYVNDGSGRFADNTALTPTGNVSEQMDILFVDVDQDFDLDLHVGTRTSGTQSSRLWLNNGAGTYVNQAMPTDTTCYSYDAGDFDGDGDFDLLGVNAGTSNAELLLANANGLGTSWTNVSSQLLTNPTTDDNDSRFFDIDMDGDLDIVVGTLGSSSERIYRNNRPTTANFSVVTGAITAVTDSSLDVKVADVDNDGDFDIVTAQGESGAFQNQVYINATGPADQRPPRVLKMESVVPGADPAPHIVRAIIVDDMTSDRGFHDRGVKLSVRSNQGPWTEVTMVWSGNNLWRGVLPAQPAGASVDYFVTARDWANNLVAGEVKSFVEGGTPANPADLNGDTRVDGADLGVLLGQFGIDGSADINNDGTVDGADLGLMLAAWAP